MKWGIVLSGNENRPLAAIDDSYKNSNASVRKSTALKRATRFIAGFLMLIFKIEDQQKCS